MPEERATDGREARNCKDWGIALHLAASDLLWLLSAAPPAASRQQITLFGMVRKFAGVVNASLCGFHKVLIHGHNRLLSEDVCVHADFAACVGVHFRDDLANAGDRNRHPLARIELLPLPLDNRAFVNELADIAGGDFPRQKRFALPFPEDFRYPYSRAGLRPRVLISPF